MRGAKKKQFCTIEHHTDLKVTDLIEKAALQAIQDQFTDEFKVANGLLDTDAVPITFERGHCKYCVAMRKIKNGCELCSRSDKIVINAIKRHKKAFWHICEGGLLDLGAPILIESKIVAFLLWGQIRCELFEQKRNDISVILGKLGFGKTTDGECKAIPSTLRKKYFRIPSKNNNEILAAAKAGLSFAKRLSGIISMLVRWKKPLEVQDFVSKMVQTEDLNSLFDLCVFEIPKLLETEHCSIFKVVKIENDMPRLVLQRTSYKKSKDKEGRAYYLEGQGLTGWVWENQQALRISDIKDEQELKMHPGLEWSHGSVVNDSDVHKEWLGVPLFGRKKDVIGVIRVPIKKDNRLGGGFDFKDEMRLMLIGQYVADEIELLEAKERIPIALRVGEHFAVNLSKARDFASVAQAALNACKKIFGKDGKAYFFNMLNKDDRKLRVQGIAGSLTMPWMIQKKVPPGSLSGKCVKKKQPIIVHDIPAAKKRREFFELAEGIESAMSAPISSGSEIFGALSVGANRQFEFTEEPDLHILEDIASIAGAALERSVAEESSKEYFNLIKNLPVGVYRATAGGKGRFTMANPAMANMFGFESVGDFCKIPVNYVYADPSKRKILTDEIKNNKQVKRRETYLKRKNGERFWGAVTAKAVPETGEVQHFDGIVEDITAFKNLIEGLHASVAAADELLNYPDLNSLCRRAVELAREKLKVERCGLFIKTGNKWQGMFGTNLQRKTTDEREGPLKSPKVIQSFLKAIKKKRESSHWKEFSDWMLREWDQKQKKHRDIGMGWLVMTAIRTPPSQNPEGVNLEGIMFNDTAISKKPMDKIQQEIIAVYCSFLGSLIAVKRTDEELKKTPAQVLGAKLDAWRILSARTAHIINNWLFAAQGAINSQPYKYTNFKGMKKIQRALDRIGQISNAFVNFSTDRPLNLKIIDVAKFFKEEVNLYRQAAKGKNIIVSIAKSLPQCNWDPTQINQVIGELLENANHYTPKGGNICIFVNAHIGFQNSKKMVEIIVENEGPGVHEANKSRIFEPFFSTRSDGTGLGLAIVKKNVKNHGGSIYEEGQPGKNAKFIIELPVNPQKGGVL